MKRITAIIFPILCLLAFATPVYAYIDPPDSTPSLESINVYRNLLENGDMFVLVYSNIPYATPPDTPADEAFIWRMVDTDNTTVLASNFNYVFNIGTADFNGYGYNIVSFYFSESDAPDWGEAYSIRLSGTPVAFEEPPEYNFQISSADYSDLTDSDDVKLELSTRILIIADDLNTKWGLTSDYYLTIDEETGAYLSLYGQTFFRGAIYGIQGLAPDAFRITYSDIEAPSRDWGEEYTGNLTAQFSGTWWGDALSAGNNFFDLDYNLIMILITWAIVFGVMFAVMRLGGDVWMGLIIGAVPLIACAKLGFYAFGFLGLLAAVCMLYISASLWKSA